MFSGLGSVPASPKRKSGLQLKDEGMQAVLEAAAERWRASVLAGIRAWARDVATPGTEYAFEEIREHLRSNGISEPHHHNAWGAMASKAVRERLIKPTGNYRKAKSPATRGHPVQTYVVVTQE